MQPETTSVSLPMIDVGGGLYVIIGGFIEIDSHDPTAVVLTYVGGRTRTLNKQQSDTFLRRIGLKASPIVQPSPDAIPIHGPRRS